MTKTLRALFVEDSENDCVLLVRELRRGGYQVEHRRVDTEGAMREALAGEHWDIVFSDYSMPAFNALHALRVHRDSGIDTPFIVVSGTVGEETAVEALKAGAHDFLLKDRLARFLPAVERELRDAAMRRERRAAENALRDSELKYRRIVETAQEGIWMVDASGVTTYINRRMSEMLGCAPEAVIGHPLVDFIEPEWRETALKIVADGGRETAQKHEVQFRRANGTDFFASLSANSIRDDSGRYVGALTMVTDVTEQRQLQEQLMVSDRMASVGTLAAGVAHEINNPLAAVLANLDLMNRELDDVIRQFGETAQMRDMREMLKDAQDAGERVRHIVRDLKIFSRAQEENRAQVDVQRVLDSSVRMAWNEIRHRARVVKDFHPVPPVIANESRLGQVFLNLVINATHAIEEGRVEANEIRVFTDVDDRGRVVVGVRDTGSGMPPEVLRRLFTPFFTTKPVGVGTGLGLSICHRIVSGLGGEITVESTVGKGTLFRVVLPAAPGDAATPPEATATQAGPASRRGRVLVVDDDHALASAIKRTLSGEHDVSIANSARQGLDLIAQATPFDVILCDLMMPDMTGMDLYAELIQKSPEQAPRVIFLTGGAFTARARSFLDEVPNVRLEKPFEPASLRAIVNDRLR